MAFSKATTFVSKWDGGAQTPVWHGELNIRVHLGAHSKLLNDLVKKETITDPDVYYVSTPLPEARHPRVITHVFSLSEEKLLKHLTPAPKPANVVRWPPK